jgi:hypothetical protein
VWISHWITPVRESPRRFDTRFFVAAAPPSQLSRHDDNETIASEWVGPMDALARHDRRELTMMPPTIRNLEFVAEHRSSAEVMRAARLLARPTAILPRLRPGGTGRLRGISMPGDDDYDSLADQAE